MLGRDISIGQCQAKQTPLHRVDPRLKLIAAVTGTIVIFVYGSGWDLLAFSGMLLLVLVATQQPLLRIIKSIRSVWVILFITALLQLFLTPGQVIFRLGFLTVTDNGLFNAAIFSLRVILLVVLLAALTMTTPPLRLADGMESLLGWLRHLKVPVSRISTVVSITLLFIPNILEVSRKVTRAQAARGADFDSWNILRRVRDIIPVLVPLFVKVFHDAEELAVAMEARCYSEKEVRGRLYPLKLGAMETFLTLVFIGASIGIIFIF